MRKGRGGDRGLKMGVLLFPFLLFLTLRRVKRVAGGLDAKDDQTVIARGPEKIFFFFNL